MFKSGKKICFHRLILSGIFIISVENSAVIFLTYNLAMQNLGVQFSAFLARLPVNLIDKTIAVYGGFGVFVLARKIVKRVFHRASYHRF